MWNKNPITYLCNLEFRKIFLRYNLSCNIHNILGQRIGYVKDLLNQLYLECANDQTMMGMSEYPSNILLKVWRSFSFHSCWVKKIPIKLFFLIYSNCFEYIRLCRHYLFKQVNHPDYFITSNWYTHINILLIGEKYIVKLNGIDIKLTLLYVMHQFP